MQLQIIRIRFVQGLRALKDIGFLRAVFLLLPLSFVIYIIYNAAYQYPIWLISIYGFLIALIHLKRSDKTFLQGILQWPPALMALEYFLISIPLLISLGVHENFVHLITYAGIISLISIIPPLRYQHININFLSALIPPRAFEWKSGLRRGALFIIIIYLIALATSFHPAAIPISILILSVFPLGFYEKGEPLQILFATELPPRYFIHHKITTALKIYFLFMAPLIVIYPIFNAEFWYIPVMETLIFALTIAYMIMLKYAFYEPNEKNTAGQIFVSLGILSIFIPVLLPLLIILTIYFYLRAMQTLKSYLNDYN